MHGFSWVWGWWDLRTFLRKVENRELSLERNWAWLKLTWSHGQHCASDSGFTNMLNTANICNGYRPTCPAFANMAHNYMSSILPASFAGITLSIYSFCLLPSLIKILLSCYWNVGWVCVQLPSTSYRVGIHWQPVWTKSQESGPMFHLECNLPNWSVQSKCSLILILFGCWDFLPCKIFYQRSVQHKADVIQIQTRKFRYIVTWIQAWLSCPYRYLVPLEKPSDMLVGLTYFTWDL